MTPTDPEARQVPLDIYTNVTDFMPKFKFTRLMNDVGYTDDQSKIDLLSVNLSDEMNQLLIGQDMPVDYLGYVTRLHKLDTDVHVEVNKKTCALILGPTLLLEETQPVLTSRFPSIPIPSHLLPMLLVTNLFLPHLRLQLQVCFAQYNKLCPRHVALLSLVVELMIFREQCCYSGPHYKSSRYIGRREPCGLHTKV